LGDDSELNDPDREPALSLSQKPRRVRLRTVVGGVLVLVTAALLLSGWLLYKGLAARSELATVRAEVSQLRLQIDGGDLAAARVTALRMTSHADAAEADTSGPFWSAAQDLPYAGRPLRDVRTITGALAQIADRALPSLVQASYSLDPSTLRGADGTVNLAPIAAVAPKLDTASRTMHSALKRIDALPRSSWLSPVDHVRAEAVTELTSLTHTIDSADVGADTVPTMLGVSGPKYYMVAFENEAELRGTGGLPGSFSIMKADHGALSFVKFESDSRLDNVQSGLNLGTDFDRTYDAPDVTGDYRDANVSPNFPYAAQIWVAEWKAATGQQLDGAMTLDTTALSYLLNVSGPATLPDHSRVNAGNVVQLTQQTVYATFSKAEVAQRKLYLLEIAKAVSQRLIATTGSTAALIRAGSRAVAQRRLLVWSSDPAVQTRLETTSISGAIVATTRPYAVVALNNAAGNKLDYYLHASVSWVASGCGQRRTVAVTMSLTNDAPANLPTFVYGVTGKPGYPPNPGDSQMQVSFYGTQAGTFTSVHVDGRKSAAQSGLVLGHPVYTVALPLPRGVQQTIRLNLSEPGRGTPTLRLQPMVDPMTGRATAQTC
jgi:hypothetical protein